MLPLILWIVVLVLSLVALVRGYQNRCANLPLFLMGAVGFAVSLGGVASWGIVLFDSILVPTIR